MSKYVICPHCELNYIPSGESCCKVCDPKMRGKLASDIADANEAYREMKLKEYEVNRQSMEAFYAYRYNRSPKY